MISKSLTRKNKLIDGVGCIHIWYFKHTISHGIKEEYPLVAPHKTIVFLTFTPPLTNLKTNNTSISLPPSLYRTAFFIVLGCQISKYSPV